MSQLIINTGQKIFFDGIDYELIKSETYFKHNKRRQIYLTRAKNKKLVKLENFILGLDGNVFVKHIDGDYTNFRRWNLKITSRSKIHTKSKKPKNNKSGYKGIWWDDVNKRWSVRIKCMYKQYWGGRHIDIKDAIKAFNKLSMNLFGNEAFTHKDKNGEIII